LLNEIGDAIKLVQDTKIAHPQMEEIMAKFVKAQQIPSKSLVPKKLQRPVPDKVLREVKIDGVLLLVPATNAIGIVLCHGLTKDPTLAELENIVNSNK
jgi:hypothetical protein